MKERMVGRHDHGMPSCEDFRFNDLSGSTRTTAYQLHGAHVCAALMQELDDIRNGTDERCMNIKKT